MNYTCIYQGKERMVKTFELEPVEKSLEQIAKWAFSFLSPFELNVEDENGNTLNVSVSQRGYFYDKDGNRMPSLHTSSIEDNLKLKESHLKQRILCCVNVNTNSGCGNYKKYYIYPEDDNLICKYGELEKAEEECKTVIYDRKYYWWLYYEKLSKLYTDETFSLKKKDVIYTEGKQVIKKADKFNDVNEELYATLMKFANNYVEATLVNKFVTLRQVKKARKLFEELQQRKTVSGFNNKMIELMKLSPRQRNWKAGESVKMFMAESVSDFANIIDREEDLILAMEAIAYDDNKKEPQVIIQKNPSFKDFEIDVRVATNDEKQFVLSHFNATIPNNITVYKVNPSKQNKLFEDYQKNHQSKTEYFWHGSRCSNWASIVKNSLYCPVSATNGRMFGNGIYLAPSAQKSLGYTDGGYWAGGNAHKQILGLYKTAYDPLLYSKGTCWSCSRDYKGETLSANKTCLHAKGGDFGLRNDEVIFYDNSAVCLEYLVMID